MSPIVTWSLAGAITLSALLVLLMLRRLARRYHRRFLESEKHELLDLPLAVLSRTTVLFLVMLSAYAGMQLLTVPARIARIVDTVVTIVVFFQVGLWLSAAVMAWLERKRLKSLQTDRAMVSSIGIIGLIARGLIWSLVLLLALDNLGIDITALVAGLGIGGVAVALAVQNILGDLFASLSIALDKPFVVGDFLSVGDFLGSVEYIGIKSTRLRSLSGEQIVISNADLLSSRIRNYGRMAERRVVFGINVPFETPAEKLEQIPQVIRNAVEAQQLTRFDRSHFARYGAHALEFETVYYVLSPDYNRYMDIQQAINLQIFREFDLMGVEFALPVQKVQLAREPRANKLSS